MDPEFEDRSLNIVPIVVVLPLLALFVAIAVGVGGAGTVVTGVVDDPDTSALGHTASLRAGH
jgi:hypothetical protein